MPPGYLVAKVLKFKFAKNIKFNLHSKLKIINIVSVDNIFY